VPERVEPVLTGAGPEMVFQPIVILQTGQVVGFEALARFAGSPTKTPDIWFADARRVGVGPNLELFAARRALTALTQVPAPMYLSVNLSPLTIVSPSFLEIFESVADRIVIEVSEHARVQQYDTLHQALAAFRRAGGRLAVDDSGAGYASLRHILQLRPDLIKLDLSLTRGIHIDRQRRALVAAALVAFAVELDIDIVAEGVEKHAELDALITLGVRYGQGYPSSPSFPTLHGRPQLRTAQ
jgi:EAL domain-containing protein (putative c-di-GMP-specific phosphodiesterase class I)